MKNYEQKRNALGAFLLSAGLERCGLCRKWHKSKHYDCQHNGQWGGCSVKQETKFEPKKERSNYGDNSAAEGSPT